MQALCGARRVHLAMLLPACQKLGVAGIFSSLFSSTLWGAVA